MKKLCLSVFVTILFTTLLHAQQYWQAMYNTYEWGSTGDFVCADNAGNIYVAGMSDDYGYYGEGNYSIWEWNGATWSRLLDTSGITNFGEIGYVPICSDPKNNVYTTYYNYSPPAHTGWYVAKWNGTGWSLLDNSPWDTTGNLVTINTDQYGNVYAAVSLDSAVNGVGIGFEIYKWSGTAWSQLGEGLPALENQNGGGINTICADKYGNVYVGGLVTTQPSSQLGNIMVWNVGDSAWSAATYGGDLIYGQYDIDFICADTSGNVYALDPYSFLLDNGSLSTNIMQWNGEQWAPLNGNIGSYMCFDGAGNLYLSTNDGVYTYSRANWSPVGNMSAYVNGIDCHLYGSLNEIAISTNGIIYSAPDFFDLSGIPFMLQYNTLAPGQLLAYIYANGEVSCTTQATISVTAYGGTPPYQYKWSNSQNGVNSITVSDGSIYTVTVTDAQNNQTTAAGSVCAEFNSTISGLVFEDVNNNCVYDSGVDVPLSGPVYVNFQFAYGGSAGVEANGGSYSISTEDTGIFTASIVNYNYDPCTSISYNYCFVNGDSTGYMPGLCSTASGPSIAITNYNYVGKPDLTMHVGWTASNPGFGKQYWVMPYNLSDNPAPDSVTIVFNYDPNLIYDSAQYPLPTVDVNAHTLTWVVSGYNIPYYTWSWLFERLNCFFTVPALSSGYVLQSSFVIEPVATDCDSTNNKIYIPQIVTGSFDPNEKDVYPSGGLSDADTVLYYTIFYQNTGTDSTHFITVTDTLSQYLEPYTALNLASSNNYSSFTVFNNILTWTFSPLALPDSSVSQTGSKGFITFSVNRNSSLPIGTQITNNAAIVFDYNPPVFTNTVTSTIGATAGIKQLGNDISVRAFPNPFNDITHIVVSGVTGKFDFSLYDVTGRLQLKLTPLATKFDIARNELAAGVYLYNISQADDIVARGKLVVK